MRYHILLVVGALLALASGAYAYPTLTGPTGGAVLPDADVAGLGQLNVAADWVNEDTFLGVSGLDVDPAFPVRATFGVAPGWEVGAAYTFQNVPNASGNLDGWGVNAKYQLKYALAGANLAIGAQYQDLNDLDLQATNIYLVGTKRFTAASERGPGVTASLGLNFVDADLASVSDSSFRPYLMATLDFTNKASVVAEYRFKDSDFDNKALSALTVRYPFSPALTGQIGVTNSFRGIFGGEDHNVFAGINYSWGGMTTTEDEGY